MVESQVQDLSMVQHVQDNYNSNIQLAIQLFLLLLLLLLLLHIITTATARTMTTIPPTNQVFSSKPRCQTPRTEVCAALWSGKVASVGAVGSWE